jgi:hypothetical protein
VAGIDFFQVCVDAQSGTRDVADTLSGKKRQESRRGGKIPASRKFILSCDQAAI